MKRFSVFAFIAAATSVASRGDTPIQRVVTLLEDLKAQIEAKGQSESTTYDKFACFCKDNTKTKSEGITKAQDEIDTETATIEEDTASRDEKKTELKKRKKDHEELVTKLQEVTVQCAKDTAELDAKIADVTKAVAALENAIDRLKEAKPASLLALTATIQDSLALADALKLTTARHRRVLAFLQQSVDPLDPEYKFHSGDIISTLEDLQTKFTGEKEDLITELEKLTESCNKRKEGLNSEIDANKEAMETLSTDIDDLTTSIAEAKTRLAEAETLLKEDSLYLKDLTVRCEAQGTLWDQRSKARAEELAALTKALAILSEKLGDTDEVNQRALLTQKSEAPSSFLQQAAERREAVRLRTSPAVAVVPRRHAGGAVAAEAVLRGEGKRLNSQTLSALALKVASDPFAKIKEIIQTLIERLLNEAKGEATKQGFCDTELGKARTERGFKLSEARKLAAAIGSLETQRDELELELEELATSIEETTKALEEATELRATQKADNLDTIEKAKAGHEAVTEAIGILKEYYKGAAKAFLQESPVEPDAPEALSGPYRGEQGASKGIIGLLEVIQSDFDRTVRHTTTEEKAQLAEFVEFDRTSKVDIAGKKKQTALSTQELESTKEALTSAKDDLKTAMDVVDAALKTIEDLKPMCIDTGMSYDERVAKREEEIEALKTALCHLDPDGVEPDC